MPGRHHAHLPAVPQRQFTAGVIGEHCRDRRQRVGYVSDGSVSGSGSGSGFSGGGHGGGSQAPGGLPDAGVVWVVSLEGCGGRLLACRLER